MAGAKKTECGLTLKQIKFVKVYLEEGNATEAAWQAFDCKDRNIASAIGSEYLRKLGGRIGALMVKRGLTEEALIEKLSEGLEAFRTEIATYEGKITDTKEFTDFVTRQRYLDTALKLLGAYAPEKRELSGELNHSHEHGVDDKLAGLLDDFTEAFTGFVGEGADEDGAGGEGAD